LIGLYFSLPSILSHTPFHDFIKQHIRSSLDQSLEFQDIKIRVLPTFSIEVDELLIPEFQNEFTFQDRRYFLSGKVATKHLRFHLAIFPLLIGQVKIQNITFNDLELYQTIRPLDTAHQEEASLSLSVGKGKLSSINFKEEVHFELKGKLTGTEGTFEANGSLRYNAEEQMLAYLEGQVMLDNIDLKPLHAIFSVLGVPFQVHEGIVSGRLEGSLNEGQYHFLSDLAATHFKYEIRDAQKQHESIAFPWTLKGRIGWVSDTQRVSFEEAFISLGDSLFRLNGFIGLSDLKQYDMTLFSETINLDSLPQIIPSLSDWIPLYLGFSGEVGCDIFLKLNEQENTIKGNFDFEKTLLNIEPHFHKEANYPFTCHFQILRDKDNFYSGDIDISLNDLDLKATLIQADLEKQWVEANFLTNDFALETLRTVLPGIQHKALEGRAKVSGKIKTDFIDFRKATFEGNVVFNQAGIALAQDFQLKGIDAEILWSPQSILVQDARFQLNNSEPIQVNVRIEKEPDFRYDIVVQGGSLDLSFLDKLWVNKQAAPTELTVLPTETTESLEPLQSSASSFELPAFPFEVKRFQESDIQSRIFVSFNQVTLLGNDITDIDISLLGIYQNIVIDRLAFDFAGGHLNVQGDMKFRDLLAGKLSEYNLVFDALDIETDQLRGALGAFRESFEGHLNARVYFQEEVPEGNQPFQMMTGGGALFAENGRLGKIDFLGILGTLQFFLNVRPFVEGFTSYDQLEAHFKILEQKIMVNDIFLQAPSYRVSGVANIGFDKSLNCSLHVLLGQRLSDEVGGQQLQQIQKPIPIFLHNTIDDPKFSIDKTMFVSNLINTVVQSGLMQLLGETTPTTTGSPTPLSEGSERSAPIT